MKRKKRLFSLLTVVIISILLINKYNLVFNYKVFIELLKLNQSLTVVSSNFYSNPTSNITYKDIVFKNRDMLDLKLDIYYANKELPNGSPVIIYVFGDCWMYGDKTLPDELIPIIDLLRDEGITVISTSYELLKDEAIFDKQISDIKDTIRWVYKNKDIYNFDVDNIGIIGPSSGAQLAMMASYSDDNSFVDDKKLSLYPSKVDYVIDLFGPSDLSKVNISTAPKEIVNKLNNYNMNEISDLYSPMNIIDRNLPNTLVIHSTIDDIVPYNTSLEMYYKALKYNNNFQFLTLNSCNHYMENLSSKEALSLYLNIINFIYDNSLN